MKHIKRSETLDLAEKAATLPKETLYKKNKERPKFTIGIPKEVINQEKRIPIKPDSIQLLTGQGYEVIVENGAGDNSKFSDNDYSEAGAKITYDRKEVFKSNIIVKVAFPTKDEIELMATNQLLISALNLPHLESDQLKLLMQRKVTAISFQDIMDDSGIYPIIQSMSEIAGRAVILTASELLAGKDSNGMILGGITGVVPTEVVILGAGTVGQYAAKTAKALDADVKVFDNSIYKLRRLKTVHSLNVYNSVIQPQILYKVLKSADVVIGALRAEYGKTPCVVSEDMVMQMKEGSVIIDVSIDKGGCFETSKVTTLDNPTYLKHNIIHYCVPNIPSRIPQTASRALSNILTPILLEINNYGDIDSYLWEKVNARNGIYMYKGILTNQFLGEKFNINSKSIDLLITSNL